MLDYILQLTEYCACHQMLAGAGGLLHCTNTMSCTKSTAFTDSRQLRGLPLPPHPRSPPIPCVALPQAAEFKTRVPHEGTNAVCVPAPSNIGHHWVCEVECASAVWGNKWACSVDVVGSAECNDTFCNNKIRANT